jgi:hypothetical protein
MSTTADELRAATWRTSTHSGVNGDCVAVARLSGGRWAVRDSKDPQGPALVFTAAEWAAFTAGVRDGEFDPIPG